jgi:hypothetical protein
MGHSVRVTVHSLGAIATPAGTATLEDAAGHVLASARIPSLAAPLDLLPRTSIVQLSVPAGAATAGLRVRVALPAGSSELTQLNNVVALH